MTHSAKPLMKFFTSTVVNMHSLFTMANAVLLLLWMSYNFCLKNDFHNIEEGTTIA